MTIKYLTLLEKTPVLRGRKNVGVPLSVIEAYEKRYKVRFPEAYREYLFLAGYRSSILVGVNGGGFPEYKTRQQLNVKKLLKEEGLQIPGGDFWITTDLDGGEQFDFFYFNDPDAEDPENPPIYGSYPGYLDEGYPLKKKHYDRFSDWIDELVLSYLPKDN